MSVTVNRLTLSDNVRLSTDKEPLPELHDDMMFKCVMSNHIICRQFIELVVGIEISSLGYYIYDEDGNTIGIATSIDVEKELLHDTSRYTRAHGARLDLYVEERGGSIYNIEMQNKPMPSLAKRVRYYQSAIDRQTLKAGERYSELANSCIIFVCNHDAFGEGYPIYRRETYMSCDGRFVPYDDGSSFICLNAHYTEMGSVSEDILDFLNLTRDFEKGVKSLMTDFGDMVAAEVAKYRRSPEFLHSFATYRTAGDDLIAEGRAEERKRSLMKTSRLVDKLVSRGNTLEEALELCEMSREQYDLVKIEFPLE